MASRTHPRQGGVFWCFSSRDDGPAELVAEGRWGFYFENEQKRSKERPRARPAPLPFCAHRRPLFLRTIQQKKSRFALVKFDDRIRQVEVRSGEVGEPPPPRPPCRLARQIFPLLELGSFEMLFFFHKPTNALHLKEARCVNGSFLESFKNDSEFQFGEHPGAPQLLQHG